MKVKFNLDIFICILIVFVTNNFQKYILFMLFIIIHELSHLIIGVILGLEPKSINIYAFGVSLEFYSFGHIKYKSLKKILIYISGPIANFLIAIMLIILNQQSCIEIIYINIILGMFNLFPIYPMDGGRILKELIHLKKGEKSSKIIINKISNIFVLCITTIYSILILYIHNLAIFMVIIYLWIIILKENKRLNVQLKIYEIMENNKFSQ